MAASSPDGVSVIICCYNSAPRLPETLRHLAKQKFSTPIAWEVVVVVDRSCKDNTWEVAESFAGEFAPGQLRVVEETRRGLGFARIGGMNAARYEYLSYVDDDNWVIEDWVEIVHRFFSSTPDAGAVGGQGEAVYENGTCPEWFPQFAGYYAATAQYDEAGDITDKPTHLLWGASLGMRKSVFEQLIESGFEFTCTERLGPKLYKLVAMRVAEDTDLCYGIKALGWRLYYTPSLYYKHFLTQDRLSWAYVRRMMKGSGHSEVLLSLLRNSTDRNLSSRKMNLERSWIFQAGRALRRLGRIALRNPRSVLTTAVGSRDRAEADTWLGYLTALFVLRDGYAELFDENRRRFIR
jgi:glycosyltransferase involved in cell wall biosynthesis